MNEAIYDDQPLQRRPDDQPDDAPTPARVETVQPRRVRSQLAALDSHILGLQDDAESLFVDVTGTMARKTLRALYSGLDDAHKRVQRIVDAVEKGG